MGLKSMQERGRLQEGMVADLVDFDPESITDNSTYEGSWKPTTGMAAVFVNGTVVVSNDRVLPLYPGQPIRFEPSKAKFEPLDSAQWVE